MELSINGRNKKYQNKITVQQLLQQLNIAPDQVVIELNSAILSLDMHDKTLLKHGDTIELVHFVGGG